ncbi:MAG: DEAD/DEAH box helicase [Phycisphaerae bacterium]|nr:DEAD/DEAH box helicase [Phycisphaerae bacterium]
MSSFVSLGLAEPVLRALTAEQYSIPTPIQAKAIPHVIGGKDMLGCAQTGTGKTAAFALPILHRMATAPQSNSRAIDTLVLAPTRELAVQIADSFATYGRFLKQDLRLATIFGGVGQNPQVRALRAGLDIVVATPGRLEDLMQQGFVDLRSVKTLVLDEADRMLDMGFIHAIRRVVAKMPHNRQTLLFSATMPDEIRKLAASILNQPVSIAVAPTSATADKIDQSVFFVDRRNKPALLAHLFHSAPISRGLVFVRTKHGADRVVRHLHSAGIRAEAIHGNKSQNARQRALENFRSGRTPLLIASDIAARGIDVDGVSHVVNYDLTHEPETYVHRIGRTARAGASGVAISFCDAEEKSNLKGIERLVRRALTVRTDHPKYAESQPAPQPQEPRHRSHSPSHRSAAHRAPAHHGPASARKHDHARPARAGHAAKTNEPQRRVFNHPLRRGR